MANSLRGSISDILDYLRVEPGHALRKQLAEAPESDLLAMFYEMSKALSEILEDTTLLDNMKVRMPDGKVVSFKEAQKQAPRSPEYSQKPAQQVEEYVPAEDMFTYRPKKRSKSNRTR